MAAADSDLAGRRREVSRAWSTFVEQGGSPRHVRPEILHSWQLSLVPDHEGAGDPALRSQAPMADEAEVLAAWQGSPLQVAVSRVEDELRRTADDGDLVVAVTDPGTRILWTYGGRLMRRAAESVNFVAGARWDEASIGTNALALANRTGRAASVFSAEHLAPAVHNWVCWAAPVVDPVSGAQLGVVDLSTTWERTHPVGLATARLLARMVEQALPRTDEPHPTGAVPAAAAPVATTGLDVRLLGGATVHLDGRELSLTRRQTEILALLATHPEGLGLDRLHALLYGDKPVSFSTLKAEVSHLRGALGGAVASRPYRLSVPVQVDTGRVLARVAEGDVDGAVAAYAGELLPGTDSPALTELGEYVAVAVREALLRDPRPATVLRYSERVPYDTEVLERALAAHPDHVAAPLLAARLAAARA
ncbi:transcriptional regulator [Nocardioidaceae bacterium]|nr:transcriptional regulator [Nocardioidaceae bacterium]